MYRVRSCRSVLPCMLGLGVVSVLIVSSSLWLKCASTGGEGGHGGQGGEQGGQGGGEHSARLAAAAPHRARKDSIATINTHPASKSHPATVQSSSHDPDQDNYDLEDSQWEEEDEGEGPGDGVGAGVVAPPGGSPRGGGAVRQYREIECRINEDYSVPCRQEESEVYVPFTFINKYFEVYGKLSEEGGVEHFDWQHSHSRVYESARGYRTDGVFMSFEHYNVEGRERVKCVSAIEGVPVSTQWGAQGYFYPVQIAQYGLSHYSKLIAAAQGREEGEEGQGLERVVEPGGHVMSDGQAVGAWAVQDNGRVRSVVDSETGASVIQFEAADRPGAAEVSLPVPPALQPDPLGASNPFVLSLLMRLASNGSVTVVVEPVDKSVRLREIRYDTSSVTLSTTASRVRYGLGARYTGQWRAFIRDIAVDFQKGVAAAAKKSRRGAVAPPRFVSLRRIVRVELRGDGAVCNVTLAHSAHLAMFYEAADWFVRTQDARGGWPIAVARSLAGNRLALKPGWYSAMAQGHALSLLARAYLRTKRHEYLAAALRATTLFDVASADGGVYAQFAGHFPWYEEYPTTPGSFVLNGFIYSLVGLYDLRAVAPPGEGKAAERLYASGMASLRALLGLFDTGSGSVYDLRHMTLPGAAPNVARWDYHATHVNQLLLLASIDRGEGGGGGGGGGVEGGRLFETVARRWIGYMKGKRAAHN